jgi:hypothetical protein
MIEELVSAYWMIYSARTSRHIVAKNFVIEFRTALDVR